jgi:hypothetical protein
MSAIEISAAEDCGGRRLALDRLRGLAIGLMVADHALVLCAPTCFARYTVTRLALPLFMLIAGRLLHNRNGPSAVRVVELLAAAVASFALESALGMRQPGVLLVFLLALLVWPVADRYPTYTLAACFVALATVPVIWGGYHLAVVLGLMVLGRYRAAGADWERFGLYLPSAFGVVGRYPLALYVGHLLALVAGVAALESVLGAS